MTRLQAGGATEPGILSALLHAQEPEGESAPIPVLTGGGSQR